MNTPRTIGIFLALVAGAGWADYGLAVRGFSAARGADDGGAPGGAGGALEARRGSGGAGGASALRGGAEVALGTGAATRGDTGAPDAEAPGDGGAVDAIFAPDAEDAIDIEPLASALAGGFDVALGAGRGDGFTVGSAEIPGTEDEGDADEEPEEDPMPDDADDADEAGEAEATAGLGVP